MATPFARLGELARNVGTGTVSRAVDAVGERRAAEAFANRQRMPGLQKVAGLATIFATAAAAFVIFAMQISRNRVSWTVDGSPVGEGTYISPVNKEAAVRFSEGSEITVQRGSRLRIAEAGQKTVKAVLEVGATRVRTTGRAVDFKIEAGPFSVSPSAVASLMVEWLADELLHVVIFEGETSVYGTPSPLKLHAGQQVSANARDGTVEVGPVATPVILNSTVPPEVQSAPPAPLSGEEPAALLAPALPSSSVSSRRATWSDAVGAGDYASVLREAERRGMTQVLADAPLADLVALADAARLSGRIEVGKRALAAERSRFPRTGAAKDAAFFLGRIADDQEHAWSSALTWYETYLSEAPHGHFAAEAFGRKMVALSRHSGRAAARETAVEYLKRFPGGPHAALARDLVDD